MIDIRRLSTDPFIAIVDPWIVTVFYVDWLVRGIILPSILEYSQTSGDMKLKIINQAAPSMLIKLIEWLN